MKINELNDVITVEELCDVLRIGKPKAYELLKANVIKSLRIGKRFIIPRKSVEEFLDKITSSDVELSETESPQIILIGKSA